MKSELTLACVVFWQDCREHLLIQGCFISLLQVIVITSNSDENNGKPAKQSIQPANLLWWQ